MTAMTRLKSRMRSLRVNNLLIFVLEKYMHIGMHCALKASAITYKLNNYLFTVPGRLA
jgi:hypothetical protein